MATKAKQTETEKALVELSARALEESGKTALAAKVRENATDMYGVYAAVSPSGQLNDLSGYLYGFIAKQFVEVFDFSKLYGDIFKEGEEIDVGSGFNFIEVYTNNVGLSAPLNYQTATEAAGTIAFGDSFSGAQMANFKVTNIPFNQIDPNLQNWATLSMTYPVQFASFSGMNANKVSEILNSFETRLQQARKLFYYTLGNSLFNYFIKNKYFGNVLSCKTNAQDTAYKAPKNLIEALQHEIIPCLEYMQQMHYIFNAGFQMNMVGSVPNGIEEFMNNEIKIFNAIGSTPNALYEYFNLNLPNWYEINSGQLPPNMKSSNPSDLQILMSVKTSASLKALMASNYLGIDKYDIQTSGDRVTKLCGIDVVVVGSNVQLPALTQQGTQQTTGSIGSQLMDDNTIIIMEKDTLTFHKYYDKFYKTDTFVNSMIQVGKQQIGFLPWFNPFKQGIILQFDADVLTATQYLTVKQAA